MKIPFICFLDSTLSGMITESNQILLEYLYIGFCEEPVSLVISNHCSKRKIFLDQNLYKILQKRSREASLYPGNLAGILITNAFLNYTRRFSRVIF